MQRNVFMKMFKGKTFFEKYSEKFEKELKEVEKQSSLQDRWRDRRMAECYVRKLIIIHNLCDG